MAVYFYKSTSGDGWRNLAVDKYFLEHLGAEDILLYLYVNQNAVIIGKNQNAWKECNLDAMERDNIQLVRRHTGGGAVFHDGGNLNFSFIMGEENYDLARQMGVIMVAMQQFGLAAELSGRNDILIQGKKFSGNAFGVHKGMRGHHGTLLVDADLSRLARYLNVSPKKIQSKGIDSVRARVCNLKELREDITVDAVEAALVQAFVQEYGTYTPYDFPKTAQEEIAQMYQEQASWEWRLGKAPKFDYQIEECLSFGEIQLLCGLRKGRIEEIKVYSDALDTGIAETVEQALAGVRFDVHEMADRLTQATQPNAQLLELAEYIRTLVL